MRINESPVSPPRITGHNSEQSHLKGCVGGASGVTYTLSPGAVLIITSPCGCCAFLKYNSTADSVDKTRRPAEDLLVNVNRSAETTGRVLWRTSPPADESPKSAEKWSVKLGEHESKTSG